MDGPHGRLIREVRKKRKYRKRRSKVKQLKDRVFIDKRPKIVQKRGRVGDCEGDFIVSGRRGKGYLLVVIDRKIRVAFIEQILDVTVENVHEAFMNIKKKVSRNENLNFG